MVASSKSPNQPTLPVSERTWFESLHHGILFYYLTSLVVLFGIFLGFDYLRPTTIPRDQRGDLLAAFANWDGRWYQKIAEHGYHYDPHKNSSVAFFPAFPLLGRLLADLTDLRTDVALLIIAHVTLAAAFVLLAAYTRQRWPDQPQLTPYVLLAFGLLPTTFFFRMAYSEGLFLLGCVAAVYALERRWPGWLCAALIGLTTATRPTGVALLLPLTWHLWHCSATWRGFGLRCLVLLPLACWGLAAYMLYQWHAFGDPLVFAKTQEHWRVRPAVPLPERLVALVTLEPLWCVVHPESPCYWQKHERPANPLFSLQLANPVYFVAALVLVGVGAWRRWLNVGEVLLALGLLLIPYLTRSHEMCMGSMGRFAAAAVPIYLVLGQFLQRMPTAMVGLVCAVSGFYLGVYAALFAAWHRVF